MLDSAKEPLDEREEIDEGDLQSDFTKDQNLEGGAWNKNEKWIALETGRCDCEGCGKKTIELVKK